MQDHTLAGADGVALRWREWPCAQARGTVGVVHGLGEHIGRYEAVAQRLNAWGWRVVGHDQRGHGRSGGAHGALPRPDAFLQDLGWMITAARGQSGQPFVLLGHSMGGLIAARFVAEGLQPQPAAWWQAVDALVLSSPAFDLGMNVGQKLLLAVLGRLAPNLAVGNGLKPAWLSRDQQVVRDYASDALVHDRVTPALVRFMLAAGEEVHRCAPQWRLPTLLMFAGADRCVAPAGSTAFAAAASTAPLAVHEFAPLFHEIFNEPEREQVFTTLLAWLTRSSVALH